MSWKTSAMPSRRRTLQVEASVEDFKQFIQARGRETGASRGKEGGGAPRRSSGPQEEEGEEKKEDQGRTS